MGTAGGRKWARGKGEHAPAIEIYLTGRYFAVTHECIDFSALEIRHVRRQDIENLIRRDGPAFAGKAPNAEPVGPPPAVNPASAVVADLDSRVASLPGAAKLLAGDFSALNDQTRSGVAMAMCRVLKVGGFNFDDAAAFLREWEHTADWCAEKGDSNGGRELRRMWDRSAVDVDQRGAEFPPLPAKTTESTLRLLRPTDCEAAPGRAYVVKGLLAAGDVACIFGAPGAGKSILAPVAVEVDERQEKPQEPKLSRSAAAALDVLEELAKLSGEPTADGRSPVAVEDWRAECVDNFRVSSSPDREARARAFRRAFDTLKDCRRVETRGDQVWVSSVGSEFPPLPDEPDKADGQKHSQTLSALSGRQTGEEGGRTRTGVYTPVRLSAPTMPRTQNELEALLS